MAQLFIKLAVVILISTFVISCSQQVELLEQKEAADEQLAVGPEPNSVILEKGFVSAAFEATGGLSAWVEVRRILLECVVTFYKQDGTFYLTEQVHQIFPWSNSIRILSPEPQGRYIWQLSDGKFSVLEAADTNQRLPSEIGTETFATAILEITTAPVRFLDKKAEFEKRPQPIKIEGLLYWPIRKSLKAGQSGVAGKRAIFCQNQDTSLIDIIWYIDESSAGLLAVRTYNYSEFKDEGILLPGTVEIFRASSDGVLKKRLAKIDYHRR